MKKNLIFSLLLSCGFVLFQSCNDDGNNPADAPDGNNAGGNISLSYTGEVSNVSIACPSSWHAETDDKWLQLSLMGGKGNETVEVIAAYNTSGESRCGEIRIYPNNAADAEGLTTYSSKNSPVQVITVVQDGNTETVKPPCFTEFYFENGSVYYNLYGGSKGGTISDDSNNDIKFYPKATPGLSVPLVDIKSNKYMNNEAYVYFSNKEELRGFFNIGRERTANTLVLRQGNSFRVHDNLNNEGSASVHFVYEGKLYYGGGIASKPVLGGSVKYAYDLNCLDLKSGTETKLASITNNGTGFGWDGSLFFINSASLYVYGNDAWNYIGMTANNVIGAQVNGNVVYLVTREGVKKYNIAREDGSIKFVFVSENLLADNISSNTNYTHDENGNLYVYDRDTRTIFWIENDALRSIALSGTFDNSSYMCGVDNGYAYITNGKTIYRAGKSGNAEMLRMVISDFEGEYENIDGTIYCFGGITSIAYSNVRNSRFNSFTPSEYVPVSLAIVPAE